MATIPDTRLKKIKHLYYKQRSSMSQIARELAVSLDAVVHFMRKHNLARRDAHTANVVRFEHQKPTFHQNYQLNLRSRELQAIGVALYWAEGYKSDKSVTVDFANSDSKMISIFLSFLRSSFTLTEKKFRVLLYCHHNQDANVLIKYWNKKTGIPVEQFTKPYIRLDDRREDSSRRMLYGLVHIRYHDKKLLLAIKNLIGYYQDKFAQVDP